MIINCVNVFDHNRTKPTNPIISGQVARMASFKNTTWIDNQTHTWLVLKYICETPWPLKTIIIYIWILALTIIIFIYISFWIICKKMDGMGLKLNTSSKVVNRTNHKGTWSSVFHNIIFNIYN